jgi:hypothetical protein
MLLVIIKYKPPEMLRAFTSMIHRGGFSYSRTSTILEKNSILLAYLSPLSNYTFLNISPINIGSDTHSIAEKLRFEPLDAFLSKVKERLHILKALK